MDTDTEKRINHKELHIVDGHYFTGGNLRFLAEHLQGERES